MATGQRTFTTEGREAKKFESKPPTPGEYEMVLRMEKWKVGKADGAGKLPYLTGPIELLNTASQEGGKNRTMYHMFFLDLTPGKNGAPMVDRADQLVGFARSVGTEMEGINVETTKKSVKDAAGQETGELVDADVLNAQQALEWLQQFDGSVFRGKTKIEKGTQGYPDKGKVEYFIEADEAAVTAPSNEAEELEVAAEEEDEDADELPPPPAKKATVSKLPQKKVANVKRR